MSINTPPTLLLLTGMLCDRASWQPVIDALSAETVIIVPDYRNGRSMTAMAQEALAQAPERFSVAGHSMGGRVALEIARLAPHCTERLCLIGTEHLPRPEGDAGERETATRTALLDVARRDGMKAMAERWLPALIPADRLDDRALCEEIMAMIARHTPEQFEAHIAAGHDRPDHRALLGQIRCAALLIGGGRDVLRPVSVMQEMASHLPGAEMLVLPGSGHMPMMEYPEEVAAALRRWLATPQPAVVRRPEGAAQTIKA